MKKAMLFYPPRSDALYSNYFEDLLCDLNMCTHFQFSLVLLFVFVMFIVYISNTVL